MTLAIAFAAACVAYVALRAAAVWWFLAACQPLLLIVVAAARRHGPAGAAWWGLAAGLATDLLADRIVGPGGIAMAAAAAAVAVIVRRLELAGPLSWIVGTLVAGVVAETVWMGVYLTLDAGRDHGMLGAAATVATTAAAAMLVAAGERMLGWWRSPARARRRELKRL